MRPVDRPKAVLEIGNVLLAQTSSVSELGLGETASAANVEELME
jgi:hypothetical protein